MSDNEVVPTRFVPLADRVLGMLSNTPQWDFKVVRAFFPNEHEKALYRALKELEESGRIRYLGWQGRTKQYTTLGISKLPQLTMPDGYRFDIKMLFPLISKQYDKDGHWIKLQEANDLFITLGQMFIIAQLDESELKDGYGEIILKLGDYKKSLQTMLGYVDAVLSHPVMSGNPKLFKAVLTGDSPSQQQIGEFKVWLSKLLREREAND